MSDPPSPSGGPSGAGVPPEELRELHEAVAALRQEIERRFGGLRRPTLQPARWAREIRSEVRKALNGLSPRSAEIFVLRYFEGYDNHEIARMLGSSRSTIAVILHRARHRVREAIGPYVGEAP